jgi:hypothetical protein
MEIGPIPSIASIPVKVSPAAPADLPSTRAVAFYPKQEDSSYTPSQQEQSEPDQQEAGEQNLMKPESFASEVIESKDSESGNLPDDSPAESTISLFA